MSTILQVAQKACRRAKTPTVTDLFSNDDQAREYLGYIEEASEIIFSAHFWRRLIKDTSFTTVLEAGEPKTDYDLPEDFGVLRHPEEYANTLRRAPNLSS